MRAGGSQSIDNSQPTTAFELIFKFTYLCFKQQSSLLLYSICIITITSNLTRKKKKKRTTVLLHLWLESTFAGRRIEELELLFLQRVVEEVYRIYLDIITEELNFQLLDKKPSNFTLTHLETLTIPFPTFPIANIKII
jgi:hypothetical protein